MVSSSDRIEQEFEQLLKNYAKILNAHIKKYDLQRYGLDPDDILQDVRIKLWKIVQGERIIFSHGHYLRRIISSSVIDQLRKAKRQDALLRYEQGRYIAEVIHAYHKETARKKQFDETVGKAVDRLIGSRRQVVKLYLMSFSVHEISSYMNWSLDKTRNLLYRGLADLKKILKDLDAKNEVR